MMKMTKIEKAVTWALAIANDNTHGYDQQYRWDLIMTVPP
mgnify:FL=1